MSLGFLLFSLSSHFTSSPLLYTDSSFIKTGETAAARLILKKRVLIKPGEKRSSLTWEFSSKDQRPRFEYISIAKPSRGGKAGYATT